MDISKVNLFGEELNIKDTTARQGIADTNIKLNSAETQISTLETRIDNIKTDYINNVPYPYHNMYLDGVNGNDDNDGLTRQTAFKTYDRAMEEANRWGDFRIWILTSGEYYWSNPTANGITLHIVPQTNGITLKWGFSHPTISVSIYNSHFNIGDDDYRMTLALPTDSDSKGQRLYFENCAALLNNLDLNIYSELGFFGGNFNMFDCNLRGWLNMSMCNGYMSHCEVTPTKGTRPMVTVRESSALSILGSFTFHNNIASSHSAFEAFWIHASNLYLLVTVTNDGNSNFYQGFDCSNAVVVASQSRFDAVKSLGTAASDFVDTIVSSYVSQSSLQ